MQTAINDGKKLMPLQLPRFTRWALLLALLVPIWAHGQVLRLAQQTTDAIEVMAAPGDTVTIDVRADLGSQAASGLRFFVRVPREDFVILDTSNRRMARNVVSPPFAQGHLFRGAVEVRNDVLSDADPTTVDARWQMMEYAALLGPAAERGRSGSGIVASFRIVCPPTPAAGTIAIHQDPIHESQLVMADGLTEKPFLLGTPLAIHVDVETVVRPTGWADVKLEMRSK
ncbi:MAG: hypothetical protein HN559_13205 [Gemmatimonadetes bacterium]|nr:hypothetical protein [Gemmatimonadota bacterium]